MPLSLAERSLFRYGAILVLLAMATGLLIGQFPRVGLLLSAHLAATMAGTFMVAVAAGLHKLALTDRARGLLVYTLAASGYLNWVATILGALLGTHALTPVHGAGTAGTVAEAVVAALLVPMVVSTLVSLVILVRGTAVSTARGS